ncbi:MotA/TolQ/ExbB proton channel family protein [Helicobacter mustelae]|uniref:ExbB\tolQ family transport protein n=1 Tax=Helicobacter mustelae (strain ATCC 43772 / CCUG 25715 / CIP 103759 / LMG 18044 / NCTC 12198 / R85-136P) TaxID=679897 RepID=D3UGS8_HELM1|nr:MotA/TolQ/ExbB proton channel family protein [Helicobacter mustelae]CBG39699.1 exbB\tolQ family transport protein [Helicobacter mustelae 12198]SQH71205.1 ExbB/TolQ family transport protein [Helicobacter mustelae]STP12332.1 ExbB/TolQ family transport protein [Helicobacter mustelae]
MLSLQGYFYDSGMVTLIVLLWLSLYLIVTLWIFIYRFMILSRMYRNQRASLSAIVNGKSRAPSDVFFEGKHAASEDFLLIWKHSILRQSTAMLSFLSIIASTAPFIGLFGTVVEILDAFSRLGGSGQISFDVIAPIISKALVATAGGILVAIPAYSFFLILKRKAFDVNLSIQMQIDAITKGGARK